MCVCVPHTDRYQAPSRNFKTIRFRPLPASSVRKFGEWIVQEGWESVDDQLSPSEQVTAVEPLYLDKLNQFCPEKQVRLSSQDWSANAINIGEIVKLISSMLTLNLNTQDRS